MIEYDGHKYYTLKYDDADTKTQDTLVQTGWEEGVETLFTSDPAKLVPFIHLLSPSLKKLLSGRVLKKRASSYTEDIDPPVPDGMKLKDYQVASVNYMLKREKTLLAEHPGTGKSAMMLAVANVFKPRSILIICPSVAKYNWSLNEIPKWSTLDLTCEVAEAKHFPADDIQIVIINYDILQRHQEAIAAREWDYLICDESHKLKTSTTDRTILVLGGSVLDTVKNKNKFPTGKQVGKKLFIKPIPALKTVYASATPMNVPSDLWTMHRACDPDGLGGDWHKYHKRYCGLRRTSFRWEYNGATNLKELGRIMRENYMVRHSKETVNSELPKLRSELVILPPLKEVMNAETAFVCANIEALRQISGGVKEEEITEMKAEELIMATAHASVKNIGNPELAPAFAEYAELRRFIGEAKVPMVVDLAKEMSNNLTESVVIFGYHRSVMFALKEAFPDASFVVGGVSAKDRAEEVRKFQAGETKVFLGNMDAAGEAITLTKASRMIIAELDWRGTQIIQVMKRIHRMTQEEECLVLFPCVANSFDALVARSSFNKIKNIDRSIGL